MQKTPEIHAKYDPVLRIKSHAKNTRNSRRICPFPKNQKLCKKHQKFTQNYDPVLRIKSYAKNTRNSGKIVTLY